MPALEVAAYVEHLQQYPPVDTLVPELLAYQNISFIAAHTKEEDQSKVPKMGDLLPWYKETTTAAEQVRAVEEKIASLPKGHGDLPALRLKLAKLVTTKR